MLNICTASRFRLLQAANDELLQNDEDQHDTDVARSSSVGVSTPSMEQLLEAQALEKANVVSRVQLETVEPEQVLAAINIHSYARISRDHLYFGV